MADDWLTVKELARREGVSTRTVRAWTARGIVQRQSYGRAGVRVRKVSTEEFARATAPPRRTIVNEYGEEIAAE